MSNRSPGRPRGECPRCARHAVPLVSLGATLVCDGCWNELVTEAIGDETPIWLDGPPAPPASE